MMEIGALGVRFLNFLYLTLTLITIILIRIAVDAKLCQVQNQPADSCQGITFRTEECKVIFAIVSSRKVYLGQIIVISTFLPVDNSYLGVLDTKKTNTESGE